MRIATHFHPEPLAYTGSELRPHFLLTRFGLRGSALAAFIGPCRVATEHLVDWEDRLASDRIEAARMIHFIGEFFGAGLREGVLAQRLLMSTMTETLDIVGGLSGQEKRVWRDGDDLFVGRGTGARKLSVSIVTASPVSVLLHAGINIDPAGAPVPAVGLAELGVAPEAWIHDILTRFSAELESLEWACAKVRPVL